MTGQEFRKVTENGCKGDAFHVERRAPIGMNDELKSWVFCRPATPSELGDIDKSLPVTQYYD
ncbi:MAG: hypothetical protein PHT33_10395, partial [bacterium]|nr:hypothetical protein [bacterium]